MDNPKLRRNGVTEFDLPQIQKDYNFGLKVAKTSVESKDGTLRSDYSYYKHKLAIKYDAITKAQYESIVTFWKTALSNQEMLEFKFEKVTEYESYVEVDVTLQEDATFVGGSGTTNYYYSCTLFITDVNAR